MFTLACVAWADTSTRFQFFQGSCNLLELPEHPLVAFSALFGTLALSRREWGSRPAAHAARAVLTLPWAGAAQQALPRSLIKLNAQQPATENSLMHEGNKCSCDGCEVGHVPVVPHALIMYSQMWYTLYVP